MLHSGPVEVMVLITAVLITGIGPSLIPFYNKKEICQKHFFRNFVRCFILLNFRVEQLEVKYLY